MRVLFWNNAFWPEAIGGTEVWASRLVPTLLRRGHEVSVVTTRSRPDLPAVDAYQGVAVYRLPLHEALLSGDPARIGDARRSVSRLLADVRPEVLHVGAIDPSGFFHLHAAATAGIPELLSLGDCLTEFDTAPTTMARRAVRDASWVAVFSRATLEQVLAQVPEAAARTSLIPHGLEPPAAEPPPLPLDPPRVLLLGRAVPEKGFDVGLAAFAAVWRSRRRVRLTVAGDGPERAYLERQAAELGIAEAVDFLGWVQPEAVPAVLHTATIVAVPSRWAEPFGLVALEAAMHGRPVIASRTGGLPEVVGDDRTGVLVAPDDVEALAAAMGTLLDDPDRAAAIGAAARRRAIEHFSFATHVDAYEDLYSRLAPEVTRARSG